MTASLVDWIIFFIILLSIISQSEIFPEKIKNIGLAVHSIHSCNGSIDRESKVRKQLAMIQQLRKAKSIAVEIVIVELT